MPPKEKLKDSEIAVLEQWIKDGAVWPVLSAPVAKAVKPGERLGDAWTDPRNPIVQIFHGQRLDLWSFKPLAAVKPALTAPAENPIDAFVRAKRGMLGPEAPRAALARRVYFDLTGLPPAPEDVQAFVDDKSPDAFEKLVDRLLASPGYGEHWARMWLDTVRYSDSNGFDWDEFRPLAWRFRDYVIRSFNADKPYDRFVREQLAGDEIVPGAPHDSAEQDALIATAYMRLGPWDNSAGNFGEQDRVRNQMMNDLVETTGAAFLGLAMSCCRCHDHKTDPISQADYYRMKAFFAGVKFRDDLALDLKPEQVEIEKNNAALDAKLEDARARRADALASAKFRVRTEREAKLDDPAKYVLGMPEAERSDDETKKAAELEKKLEVSDDDAKKALSGDEKTVFKDVEAAIQKLKDQKRAFTTGLCVTDGDALKPTRILFQGNLAEPREEVVPGFLSALDPNPAALAKAQREKSTGRRSTLADWILSPSNPLTARVIVNRVWQSHFGTGLVATPNDFGLAGSRPSDPALLDWLAAEFVREGWSLKKLHRLILTSATYRQGAQAGTPPFGHGVRRLSAEQLRDAMLAVSGQLQESAGGPPVWPALPAEVLNANPVFLDGDNDVKTKHWYASAPGKLNVRSIYLIQKRTTRLPFLEAFDQPENAVSCPRRNVSTVAPQALALLNDEFTLECARTFAKRVEKEAGAEKAAQAGRAFLLALQRPPDEAEIAKCVTFLEKRTLLELCRALLNLDEFVYVD